MAQVSVIIPLYNKGRYIERALRSVLSQTHRDLEIVVVDDGSTDDSAEVVRRCDDNRLRLVRQANRGPGAARNRGLKESKSPLVAFLDADDEWLPAYLERTIDVLDKYPQCAAAASTYFLGTDKADVGPVFRQRGIQDGLWNVDSCRNAEELRSAIYAVNSSTTTIRRSVVEQYGGFYEKDHCTLGEDYYLWVQVLFGHSVYRILEPLVWYHIEASELGVGPKRGRALEPVFTDPEPIRCHCPPQRRPLLESWLARFALATAHGLASEGDVARAAWLLEAFPQMQTFRWECFKLRAKTAMPGAVRHVRSLRGLVQRRRKA
ncbi:MAG TPA: glycosyltransferase family A protein [Sedimentisphaerales bacterium]|nr:glycosyltransferase family A protein [Sedimentisphaerales bacterium]